MSQKSYDGSATLYLIPTPIGNLEDITLRSIEILKKVEVIFCEDTRVTLQLLKHLGIKKKLIANHQYNEEENKRKLLEYLKNGYDVGLVTDRGTPVISDPGYILSSFAVENQYNVVGLPGPTALIPALITSGISPSPFLFYGFLNSKDVRRKKELMDLKDIQATLIFYEAPHRIEKTLQSILEIMGNRKISISREISKKYEEIYRGTVLDVQKQMVDIKGEIVIILDKGIQEKKYDNLTIPSHVRLFIEEGYSLSDALKMVSKERNISKKQVYDAYHHIKRSN